MRSRCKCGIEYYMFGEPCRECGTDFIRGWFCPSCNTYTDGYECPECKFLKVDAIKRDEYNKIFTEEIMADVKRVVRAYAARRNIPWHLAEEAICDSFEIMIVKLDLYDRSRPFTRWAIAVAVNRLKNLVGMDLSRNRQHGASLDEVDEDGEPMSNMFGQDDPDYGEIEERLQRYAMKREFADQYLGTYVDQQSGEKKRLLELCFEEYLRRGGYGWQDYASFRAGLNRGVLSSRLTKLRRAWREKSRM